MSQLETYNAYKSASTATLSTSKFSLKTIYIAFQLGLHRACPTQQLCSKSSS